MSSSAAEKSSRANAPAVILQSIPSYYSPISGANNTNTNGSSKKTSGNSLFVMKCLYVLLAVMVNSTKSYMIPFLSKTWHISKDELAMTNYFHIFNFLGAILFGYVADKTGKYRVLLAGCAGGYCVSMFLMVFPLFVHPDLLRYKLAYYYFLHACSLFSFSGLLPIVDTLVLKELKASNTNISSFGYNRLWFAVGRLFSFIAPFTVPFSVCYFFKDREYFPMLCLLILATFTFIITVMLKISDEDPAQNISTSDYCSSSYVSDHKLDNEKVQQDSINPHQHQNNNNNLIFNVNFIFLLLTVLVAGGVHYCVMLVKNHYLFSELKLNKQSYRSYFYLIPTYVEVIVSFCSTYAIRWFGPYWILISAMVIGMARVLGYVSLTAEFLNDPVSENVVYYVLFTLEFLPGIVSTFVHSSASILSFEMVPTGSVFTAMGLMSGVWQGLSLFIGIISGNLIIDLVSTRVFFILYFAICAIFTIIAIIKFAVIDRVIFTTKTKKIEPLT